MKISKLGSIKNNLQSKELFAEIKEELSKKARDKFHLSNCGSCLYVAEFLTKELLNKGINDFHVIEGYVVTNISRRHKDEWLDIRHQHTWIKLSDGSLLDPSVIQFNEFDGIETINGKETRTTKTKFTPDEYIEVMNKSPLNYSDKRFVKVE